MIVLAFIATFAAMLLTILVIVYSESGAGTATVYAAWIITAILWLAVVV